VIDSRLGRDGAEIRRRRECLECGRRFTTRERVDEVLPKVVKRDERREEFQREKLIAAVQKACQKRPVSAHALDRLLDRGYRVLLETGGSLPGWVACDVTGTRGDLLFRDSPATNLAAQRRGHSSTM